jgi:hypothetical protein
MWDPINLFRFVSFMKEKSGFFFNPNPMNDRIVKIAESYIGKTEKPGNKGFNDPEFERKMRAVGFLPGHAWCAYFGELVWTEAYAGHKMLPVITRLFSPSAVSTFSNFSNSKHFMISPDIPTLGALAIWRYGDGWQGHLGVVTAFDIKNNRMVTADGNTNDKGGREGYIVANRPRRIIRPHSKTDLNLLGFVYPIK